MRGGPYVFRRAAQDEQIGQSVDHVDRVKFSIHADRQSLLCELVGEVVRAEDPPTLRPIQDKVIEPSTAQQGIAQQCPEGDSARFDPSWVVFVGL